MSAILPSYKIDSETFLAEYFLPYQLAWICAEEPLHAQNRQAFAIAEKSVRIGWTYADAFKNVRKRLRFRERPYLFATKDYPSALEYMRLVHGFAELLSLTKAIVSHGEDYLKVARLDSLGQPTAFTDEVKIGYVKFGNGSSIRAFSAHPQAMAVYGGDVGLDEFAKHPNAQLLWQTAQGRVTWGFDLAVWSSHQDENTLFNQFVQQARASLSPRESSSSSESGCLTSPSEYATRNTQHDVLSPQPFPNDQNHVSRFTFHDPDALQPAKPANPTPASPWNLYFRVTLLDALELGLLNTINETRGMSLTKDQFIADCRARAGSDEIFEQTYMCNPVPAGATLVEWSAIERCRFDYQIERVHLESDAIRQLFGEFNPNTEDDRASQIQSHLDQHFPNLFSQNHVSRFTFQSNSASSNSRTSQSSSFRLGFDVAASGHGDLAAIYIDEAAPDGLWLRALFTCRTEDRHFLKTVLFYFMKQLRNVQGAGDESGLGRQICWEAASKFGSRFFKVNFSAKKHDLGFSLMNQLSVSEKRFPRAHQDIAADYFALHKNYSGARWVFTESRNNHNQASHCDIAWAGALSSFAHTQRRPIAWAYVE